MKTKFLVDRFHWKNHKGERILPAYQSADYFQIDDEGKNSQLDGSVGESPMLEWKSLQPCCSLVSFRLDRVDDQSIVAQYHFHIRFTGCSQGYKLSTYPQLAQLNSQVAEQRNSRLATLRPILAYASQRNFIKLLAIHQHYQNLMARLRWRPAESETERVMAEVRLKSRRK